VYQKDRNFTVLAIADRMRHASIWRCWFTSITI